MSSPRTGSERLLFVALAVAVIDTVYLTWRYIALHAGWVVPGTGLCSWNSWIDCDRVLLTPEARAFYVPNATLGLGFFAGCLLWWTVGSRSAVPSSRRTVAGVLVVWLGIATALTFRFWYLLAGLDHLCPFCPWNHTFTYVAWIAAIRVWRAEGVAEGPGAWRSLVKLAAVCVAQGVVWQVAWFVAFRAGRLTP